MLFPIASFNMRSPPPDKGEWSLGHRVGGLNYQCLALSSGVAGFDAALLGGEETSAAWLEGVEVAGVGVGVVLSD